jgi:hypothetical protein
VISQEGLKMDPKKVRDIVEWIIPKSTFGFISFHGLVSFYMKFVWNFLGICASLNKFMKKGSFEWTTT